MRSSLALLGAAALVATSGAALLIAPGQAAARSAGPTVLSTAGPDPAGSDVQGPPTVVDTPPEMRTADSDGVHAAYTRGFTITNLSTHRLQLTSVSGQDKEDSGPAVGSVIEPGAATRFEVTWRFGLIHSNTATYTILDAEGRAKGTYTATMTVECALFGTTQRSTGTTSVGQSVAGGDQLTVLDAPGSVITVPAGEGQGQAQVLNQYCAAESRATCTFNPTSRVKTEGPAHVVDGVVYNNTPDPQDSSLSIRDSVTATQSLELTASVQVNILNTVETTLALTKGWSFTQEHEFTRTENLSVRPYYKAWIEAREPVFRDTGDFTVTLGNTTWHLKGVWFDTPNPDGKGTYVKQTLAMTPQEIADLDPGLGVDQYANAGRTV